MAKEAEKCYRAKGRLGGSSSDTTQVGRNVCRELLVEGEFPGISMALVSQVSEPLVSNQTPFFFPSKWGKNNRVSGG